MKNHSLKRLLALILALAMVISLVAGCEKETDRKRKPRTEQTQETLPEKDPAQPDETEPADPETDDDLDPESGQQEEQVLLPMSFDYTLTEQEVADALDLAKQMEDHIAGGENDQILSVADQLEERLDYLHHQYLVSQMGYYSDLEDKAAYDTYVSSEDAYLRVQEETYRVLKKLYDSKLPAKETFFADWTETQIRELEISGEVIALEKQRSDLKREYLALDDSAKGWSAKVDALYSRFVNYNQQLAALYGYDNYYDYAANEIYMRQYTNAQREAFRENVREQVLPCYLAVNARYQEKLAGLSEKEWEQFDVLRYDPCLQNNAYLTGYIDSFPEKMKTTMNHLFDRNAVVYTQSENAHGVAYTGYSDYCDQPFVFLGNGVQDLLTLVHEMGHYTAYYHFADAELPYDTCEVHSQGNEWLLMHYLEGKLDQDIYELFLLYRLRIGLQVTVMSTLVDEYEEMVYTGQETVTPEMFAPIMNRVLDGYEGIEAFRTRAVIYNYAQHVQIEQSVYYLSYATSELTAMLFYTIAAEESYSAAQQIYADLCLETPTGAVFFDTLADVGLPDPFDPDTVTRIVNAFEEIFTKDALQPAAFSAPIPAFLIGLAMPPAQTIAIFYPPYP